MSPAPLNIVQRQALSETAVVLNTARAIKQKLMGISLTWVTTRAEGKDRARI